MPYSQFTTISKAKQAFNLTVQEGERFIPSLDPISPSSILAGTLNDSLPIVATSGSEKARSEGIIYPVLLEVRRILDRQVSLFSGEDFTIEESLRLSGVCDFLLTTNSCRFPLRRFPLTRVLALDSDDRPDMADNPAAAQVKPMTAPIIHRAFCSLFGISGN